MEYLNPEINKKIERLAKIKAGQYDREGNLKKEYRHRENNAHALNSLSSKGRVESTIEEDNYD